MKVYEMIQELAQYEADQEVEINVVADELPVTVVVGEDTEEGEEIDTEVDFDKDITDFDIDEYRHYQKGKVVRINVGLE